MSDLYLSTSMPEKPLASHEIGNTAGVEEGEKFLPETPLRAAEALKSGHKSPVTKGAELQFMRGRVATLFASPGALCLRGRMRPWASGPCRFRAGSAGFGGSDVSAQPRRHRRDHRPRAAPREGRNLNSPGRQPEWARQITRQAPEGGGRSFPLPSSRSPLEQLLQHGLEIRFELRLVERRCG